MNLKDFKETKFAIESKNYGDVAIEEHDEFGMAITLAKLYNNNNIFFNDCVKEWWNIEEEFGVHFNALETIGHGILQNKHRFIEYFPDDLNCISSLICMRESHLEYLLETGGISKEFSKEKCEEIRLTDFDWLNREANGLKQKHEEAKSNIFYLIK